MACVFAACVILWAEYQDDITLVFEPLREASGSADLERIFQFSKERDSIKLSSIDLPTLRQPTWWTVQNDLMVRLP